MKRWIVFGVAAVAAVILVGWRTIDHASAPAPADRPATASAPTLDRSAAATPDRAARDVPDRATPAPAMRAPIHVTRLEPGEREAVAKRIADARAARAAAAANGGAPIPDHVDQLDLEHAPAALRAALDESIPIVSECFRIDGIDAHPEGAAVLMTLRGDPDVGTLVDPDQITDPDGKPLDPRLAECLHTTLDSLELPPLGQNQELPIQFTFRP